MKMTQTGFFKGWMFATGFAVIVLAMMVIHGKIELFFARNAVASAMITNTITLEALSHGRTDIARETLAGGNEIIACYCAAEVTPRDRSMLPNAFLYANERGWLDDITRFSANDALPITADSYRKRARRSKIGRMIWGRLVSHSSKNGRWGSLIHRSFPILSSNQLDALGKSDRGTGKLYVFDSEQRFCETGACRRVDCPYSIVSDFLSYQQETNNVNHRRHKPLAKLFLEITDLKGDKTCWGLVIDAGVLSGIFCADGHFQSNHYYSATPVSPLFLQGANPNMAGELLRRLSALLEEDGPTRVLESVK